MFGSSGSFPSLYITALCLCMDKTSPNTLDAIVLLVAWRFLSIFSPVCRRNSPNQILFKKKLSGPSKKGKHQRNQTGTITLNQELLSWKQVSQTSDCQLTRNAPNLPCSCVFIDWSKSAGENALSLPLCHLPGIAILCRSKFKGRVIAVSKKVGNTAN